MLCEASAEDLVNDDGGSGGGAAAWHLITTQSDLARVLARGSLKLIERPKDHVDETVRHARASLVRRLPRSGYAAVPSTCARP